MTKWIFYIILGGAIIWGWSVFMNQGKDEIREIEKQIERIEIEGYQDEMAKIPSLRDKAENIENSKTLIGIMLAFLTAGLVGVIFVIDLLPAIAHRFTHAVYDSGEMVEADVMHDARAKLAQGDYKGAVAAFRDAAAAEPENRLPWVEIAKIQRDHQASPQAAIATLREAIEQHDWATNDAAFLMFRLAETYDDAMNDRPAAAAILQQVVDQFPETRHSANARHKLHDWGMA